MVVFTGLQKETFRVIFLKLPWTWAWGGRHCMAGQGPIGGCKR